MTLHRMAWLGIVGAIAVAAVAVEVHLYQASKPIPFEQHVEAVDGIRRAQSLNESMAQEALSIRFGLRSQYDEINAIERSLEQNVDRVAQSVRAVVGHRLVSTELRQLRGVVSARAAFIERFKSEASVLRNSLYYLPLAGEKLAAALREKEGDDGDLVRDVNRVVGEVLVYNLLGSRSTRNALEGRLDALQRRSDQVPAEIESDFEIFLRHAGIVTRQLSTVDDLLERVRGEDTAAALDTLDQRYGALVSAAMADADSYRVALYAWSIVLMLLVVVAVWKLRRFYTQLERLVEHRTAELNAAMKELWGEMDLARKIQTALLPKSGGLAALEVAAIMQPADQVGGDYYDFFQAGGRDWILIGDVSGHGVASGLIMMMTQTAVRTALSVNPELSPAELLTHVNDCITDNIESLGESRYVTCTALVRDGNQFQFAGMHQDLVIYRAEGASVEVVASEGVWLGLRNDIGDLLSDRTFELNPGDALLLYTDGITEARRGGELLDLGVLRGVVERCGMKSAEAILTALLAELEGAEVDDDVAAVVIKAASSLTPSLGPGEASRGVGAAVANSSG